MPHRHKFPDSYFDSNPFEGEDAHSAYERLQWGNKPRNTFRVEAPEPMAVLGELAKLVLVNGGTVRYGEKEIFVAVGVRSNRVYLVPMRGGKPLDFPVRFMGGLRPVDKVKRIDYYSDKGGQAAYYYHDHEKPYPTLAMNGAHCVLLPARHPKGGRSYAVNDEGIIG